MMNLSHIAKDLKLVKRNREWLASPLPVRTKLAYYPSLLGGYAFFVTSHRRSVKYLGKQFYYDNPATPLNLQIYPYELGVKILRNMRIRPQRILDVGANIGQFASTLGYLVPRCEIDCIEPNPTILDLLKKNVPRDTRVFNCALGPKHGLATLYYEPNRSAIGAFVQGNAGAPSRIKNISVRIEDDVAQLTDRNAYDLVKIDVEGSEFDVLKALNGISTKYLYVEVSCGKREPTSTDAQLYQQIFTALGDFTLAYASGMSTESTTYELLLEFK